LRSLEDAVQEAAAISFGRAASDGRFDDAERALAIAFGVALLSLHEGEALKRAHGESAGSDSDSGPHHDKKIEG
jgi:hypothetical protein